MFIVCDGGVRKIAEVAKIQCKFFLLYKRLVKCNLKMDSEKKFTKIIWFFSLDNTYKKHFCLLTSKLTNQQWPLSGQILFSIRVQIVLSYCRFDSYHNIYFSLLDTLTLAALSPLSSTMATWTIRLQHYCQLW